MKLHMTGLFLLVAVCTGCVTTPHEVGSQAIDNPLIGVWDRLKIEGADGLDQGQIFIVRSDGTAVLKDSAWRRGLPEPPQPYTLDRDAHTITFKYITFRYAITRKQRCTLLTLEFQKDGKTVKQTYCLMTNTL